MNVQYLTDTYAAGIERINRIDAPVNFVFITDMHHRLYGSAVEGIASIQYILDRCPQIGFVVNGGDIGNDYSLTPEGLRSSCREVMDALYALSVPVHSCIGNHDDGIGNAIDNHISTKKIAIPPEEMHELCMRYNPTKENYYYVDDKSGRYRCVFMNTSDKPYLRDDRGEYPFGWRNEISREQALWLENDALKTDRKILVFSHAPLHNEGIFGTENPPDNIKPYDDLLGGPRVWYAVNSCRNVVACFAGHVHYDNLLYENGILMVTTLSTFTPRWVGSLEDRPLGTYKETAFDVVSIKDHVVYMTRFGCGENRTGYLNRE